MKQKVVRAGEPKDWNVSLREIKEIPNKKTLQYGDLFYEDENCRHILSRMKIADGEPYENKVIVEVLDEKLNWVTYRIYQAK